MNKHIFKKKIKLFLKVTALFFVLFKTDVLLAEAASAQFGGVYGISVPDADNTNPHTLSGVKGTAFITPTFSIGGYFFDAKKAMGTGSRLFAYVSSGLEAAFHIPSGNGDTFIAGRVGLSKIKTDESGISVIYSPYHYGFAAGYDYALASWFSLGFEGCFLSFQKSSTQKNSVRYEEDGFGTIHFLATAQFRL